jgi:N-acetylmuramoyl-L-alanine amidase
MQINAHLLSGDGVSFTESPNKGNSIEPQFLVMHYTAGRNAQSSVRHFLDSGAKASAHLVIGRDGTVCQMVPFNFEAWHAGRSTWLGLEGMNRYSIGIELDNAGRLTPVGTRYQAWFGTFYPESEVVRARHRNEEAEAFWHAYTEAQLSATLEVARLLVRHYRLKDVLGHDDIAPGRKADPGPAFRMQSFRSSLFGRSDSARDRLVVTASLLNLRAGPGTDHPKVASPLTAGTVLDLIDMTPSWAHVALTDGSGLEGWVRNSFVAPAP